MMKKKILVVLVFFISICSLNAQTVDVLYLKNGGMLRGTIIEKIPDQYVKIETKDGTVYEYRWDEVDRISTESSALSDESSSAVVSASKSMQYANRKKSPSSAMLLSCLVTSAGHAYAKNWGRGLAFTAGRVAGYLILTNGIETKIDNYGTITYEYNQMYYVGSLLTVSLAIWELVDAGKEVRKYNARLYEEIFGRKPDPDFNLSFAPVYSPANQKIVPGLGLVYTF